jgi:hypothetical protein
MKSGRHSAVRHIFNEAMGEIARVIDFAVEEEWNQQKFNLVNPNLLRVG